ncbi:uncharacterized protein LOC116620024 [Nematostella vectensis]|uniref:uncharacterized protein LOC116620024 n=1 Tax=Nematostella vectensis TaxID=45351 RepID=UPI002076F91D|nr:uncharacterized protein LOC116620024 [Nematostella vectensis]
MSSNIVHSPSRSLCRSPHYLQGFLFLVIFAMPHEVSTLTKCEMVKGSSCRASTDKGYIDLSALIGQGNSPRFTEITDQDSDNKYSWNPCKGWTDSTSQILNTCQDVSVCLYMPYSGVSSNLYGIGKANTADFKLDASSGNCLITYTGTMYLGSSTVVNIELVCSESQEGTLDPFTNSGLSTTIFTSKLHSKYACPSRSGISTGSILLIVFFSVICVYLVVGILISHFVKGATGRELVPNYSFWVDLPALIKDGCVFTFGKCRSLCGGKEGNSYEVIP